MLNYSMKTPPVFRYLIVYGKLFKTPLFNLSLNFPKLVEALDLDQTTSFRNEEYILSELLTLFHTQSRSTSTNCISVQSSGKSLLERV